MVPLLKSSRLTPCAVLLNTHLFQKQDSTPLKSSRVFKKAVRAFLTPCAVDFNTITFVALIALGFLVLPVNAGLHGKYTDGERIYLKETAVPKAAGDYYRMPGKLVESEGDTRWFGPEIDSRVLCPNTEHQFNKAGFFDIIYTREDAEVWPSARPGKVWWYRKQEWRFATADTPWGTDTAHIILVSEIGWADIDASNTVTGFPWIGFEEHWREGDYIQSKAEITGYHRHEHDGKKYLAPKYYKRGTLRYSCTTTRRRYNLKVLEHIQGHFTIPEFRPEHNKLSLRERGAPERVKDWYDCIPLK